MQPETDLGPLPFGKPPGIEYINYGIEPATPAIEHPKNPWAWRTFGDLFALCGPILSGFVLLQIASAIAVGFLISTFADIGYHLPAGILILVALLSDGIVLKRHYGRLYSDIYRPLAWVGVFTILPGALAMLWLQVVMIA
jgi:hypothetical protein